MITYRKDRSGRWLAFGPTSEMRVGGVVVTDVSNPREHATRCEIVERLIEPVQVRGVPHLHGVLVPRPGSRFQAPHGR